MIIKAVHNTPFELTKGEYEFSTSGTGQIVLTKLNKGGQAPSTITLVAPNDYADIMAGCTITPNIPGTATLDVIWLK